MAFHGILFCCFGHLPDTGPWNMPKPRAHKVESATARRKLEVHKKPYWVTISPGIALGYRRNQGAGTWSVRVAAHGGEWVKRIGLADDLEPAAPPAVLTYWQAIDAARALARKEPGDAGDITRPVTVAEAIDRYETDLKARGGSLNNASRVRVHLPPTLASKPVALLTALELKKWRDGLTAKGLAPATVNRTRVGLRAALELAAAHDPRITNVRAFKIGLQGLADANRARNTILDDGTVRRLIAAAYDHDRHFGMLVEVLASTGTRVSQAWRLEVGDLQADKLRLMMPLSAKGRNRAKALERRAVPIGEGLAALLAQEAGNRPPDAPLLRLANGQPWTWNGPLRRAWAAIIAATGIDANTTPYSLRHSSVVRALLAGTPVRLVASLHDSSVKMLEASYSRYISDAEQSDTVARRGLLALDAPASNVSR
jgi:integrase